MKKILLGGVLLFSVSVMNAQYSKKVGINTDKPTQNLDVNGTMGISKIGAARDGQDIYWNKKTGQWVSEPQNKSNEKNIYYVNYAIHLSKKGEDYAANVPLGIDPTKYEAVLTQSFFVKTSGGEGKGAKFYYDYAQKGQLPPLITASYTRKSTGENTGYMKVINGYINDQNGDAYSDQGYIAVPQKDTRLVSDDNNYYFFADYRDVAPADSNITYTWVITLLVIKKDWVKDLATN